MDASRLPCRSHVLTCTLSVCSISTARVSASTHSRIRPTWDSSGSSSPKASYGQDLLSTCRFALISSSVAMREKVHAQTLGRIPRRQLLPVLDSVGSSDSTSCPCSSSVVSSDIPIGRRGLRSWVGGSCRNSSQAACLKKFYG